MFSGIFIDRPRLAFVIAICCVSGFFVGGCSCGHNSACLTTARLTHFVEQDLAATSFIDRSIAGSATFPYGDGWGDVLNIFPSPANIGEATGIK